MVNRKSPLEDTVEEYLVKQVKALGGIALKGDIKGHRFLDRILILPTGVTVWCECKRPDGTGRYSKHQDETLKRLGEMGHQVLRVETKEEVDRFTEKFSLLGAPAPSTRTTGISDRVMRILEDHDRCPPQARDYSRRLKTASLIMQEIRQRENQSPVAHKVDELEELSRGKERPIAIWHKGDCIAYYRATEEERKAWDDYANVEASKFQAQLGVYETVHGHIGYDRDGRITNWCPPQFFPEWLEDHRASYPSAQTRERGSE